jgi:hypothetical protein
MTPETASRVALAEELAQAERDVTALQLRIDAAREILVGRTDRSAYIAELRRQLETADSRRDEARRTIAESDRARRDERARARDASRQQIREQARVVVAAMLPHVDRINALNGQLEALRAQLDNAGEVPVASFRPHLLTTTRWLQAAKRFTGK